MHATIVAVALVAVWTSLAWGECAWVLWKTVARMTDQPQVEARPPIPVRGEATQAACEAEKRRELDDGRRAAGLKPEASDTFVMTVTKGEHQTALMISFQCLPDTVDPRAPKR